jgi:hypothetical protein
MLLVLPSIAIVAVWVLLHLQVDPVPTWFYVLVWYPTLIPLDAFATRLDGRRSALWHRSMLFAFAWSPIVWLVFEAANFRLANWYYVFLPHPTWERWTGILLSFATVVPAVILAERALDAAGMFRRGRGPEIIVRDGDLLATVLLGIGIGALALGFPRVLFPLIWGAAVLIVDPFVFHRAPSLSLIGDLARGYWGRVGRLMLGGLGIGLIWETCNYWARGKWIYTVPWLEDMKLFEMPPFGFLGFPVFALEAWVMYAVLCSLGLARVIGREEEAEGQRGGGTGRRGRGAVAAAAVAFAATILIGMERWTISSTAPLIEDLPEITADQVEALNAIGFHDPFELTEAAIVDLSSKTGMGVIAADRITQAARLVTLRGIGNRHAATLSELDVHTVCDLSRQDPDRLMRAIDRIRAHYRPNLPEVRVWIRAASRACLP